MKSIHLPFLRVSGCWRNLSGSGTTQQALGAAANSFILMMPLEVGRWQMPSLVCRQKTEVQRG